jgi:Domain of unknown function (DUF4388)
MSQYPIVILDNDENRADFFESRFLRDEHQVDIYKNITALLENTQKHKEAAFLVEYNTITSEERKDVILFYKEFALQNIFMFDVPDNANKRLAFYELGAKRVFDTSQPLEEVYYGLRWPLKSLWDSSGKNLLISSGLLEDVSLKSLISTIGKEQRTGILKIVTTKNSGKIYFKDGYLNHAQVGLLAGEKAILHMLFWNSGNFSFSVTSAIDEHDTIRLSSISLFIMAEKLAKDYLNDLKNIGSEKAVIQIKYAGDLYTSSIEISSGFKELISRPIALANVMENPFYTCYETAHKLSELKNYGFLSVTEPEKKEEKKEEDILTKELPISTCKLFDKKEAEQFCQNINVGKNQEGKIFVISTESESHYDFLNCIVQNPSEIVNANDISICKAEFANKIKIGFYGLLIDQYIMDTIEKLSEDITAMVFLVNDKLNESADYSSYILRRLTGMYEIPWTASLVNTDKSDAEEIKTKYGIPRYIPFLISDVKERDHVKNLLLNLKKYEAPEEEEEEEFRDQEEEV